MARKPINKDRDESLEQFVLNLIKKAKRSKSQVLDLGGFGLNYLPSEIGQLREIIELNLYRNKLTTLPREIRYLSNLKELRITSNNFTQIPPEIFELKNLESLIFADNKLRILPKEIESLVNLRELYLSGNLLQDIPSQIGNLSNLIELDLHNNNLSELPIEIGKLSKLRVLALGSMQIMLAQDEYGKFTIPEFTYDERNTAYSGNNLSTLPESLKQLRRLKLLDLTDNHIPIPPEILERVNEPRTILNYYFTVTRQAKKPINEIKLIIIGQGSVGKTSLAQQILHGTFDWNQTKTEGISINGR